MILICVNQYYNYKILAIYSSLYFLLETINSVINHQYLSIQINQIYFYLTISSFQISICNLMIIFFFNSSDNILFCLLSVPLSIKLINEYKVYQNKCLIYQFSNSKEFLQCNLGSFLNIIRLILQHAKINDQDYSYYKYGITYENIIQAHQSQHLINSQFCFCQKYRKSQKDKSEGLKKDKSDGLQNHELSEQNFRNEFIEKIVQFSIEKYIQNCQRNDKQENVSILRLVQLNYLFEITKNPVQVLINLQQISQQFIKNSKMKAVSVFYFCQLKERIMKYYEDTFFNSNLDNQNINMMDAIYFGDKINACKEKLRSALIKSGQFYDLLCGDFISLKSIESLSFPLLQLKEELESIFVELFKINSNDLDLQYLACIYIQVLDFQNRKIPEFQKESFSNLETANDQKNLKRYYLQQSYFSGKNCVVFCSLLQNNYVINLASNSFTKIFGIQKNFILGKQLNLLVPTMIKKNHDTMIQNFIDQDSLSLIEKGQRSLFAIDKQGFVFPISLRIKIENLIDDVGACALIHRINKQKSYILFNDDGCITDFSKKIYQDLFQSSEKVLYDWQNVFRIMPYTQRIIQNKQFNTQICSAMVVKQQLKNRMSNTQIETTQAKNVNLHSYNDDVFLVQFQVCQNQTKINFNLNYLEIENYEKETNQNKKNKIIDELNKQLIQQEWYNNQNKQISQNFEFLNSYQYFLSERQLSQNIDSNNLLLMKWQEDQKSRRASRPNTKTDIASTNRIHLIFNENEDFKEENMTKCFSEQQTPINLNQKLEENFENQIDSLSWINKNDFPSKRNKSTKEARNKEIPSMVLQLKKTHTLSSNFLDFNQSPLVFSQQALTLLSNNQQDQNQIALTNSKRNIELGSNQFDCSINNFQSSNQNIAADFNFQNTKNEDLQKANQLINKQITIDLVNCQKTLSDSDKCLSIDDNIYSKRKTKSTNFQEEEGEEEKEQKKEQQNEIASVNSSKYSSEDLIKRNMIRRVNQKVFNKSLKFMFITGFVAITILVVVTFIVYMQNLTCLDNFVASFLKIDGALFCFTDVMKILALANYQVLFGNTYIQDSPDIQNWQNVLVNYEINSVLQDYNQNFEDLVLHNNSGDQLNDLQNNPFTVQVFAAGFYDSTHISFNSTQKFSQSLEYTIMQFYYEIVFYIINYAEQQEDFIWGNIVEFKQRMKNLQYIVESFANTQFNNMNTQQMTVIALVSILSFLIIFSIIPLNIYIQIKREKVMKLFGTFQPQVLELQIRLIELAIFKIDKTKLANETCKKAQPSIKSIKSSTRKQKHIYLKDVMEQALDTKTQNKVDINSKSYSQSAQQMPKYIRREQKSRNRSIASFNSLPKFNLVVICLGIVAVLMLLIQPALNILQFSPFQTESNATLQDRLTLIDIFTLLIENQGSHIESILSLVTLQVPSTTYYYTYASNLTGQNEKMISQLSNLTTNLGIQRYNQNLFEDFYKNILNSDICQVRQNFPQYFNSNVTQSTCETLFNGILKRGLLLSIKKVFQTFEELLEMYAISDLDSQLNFYIQFQSEYSYVDFKLLIQVISESVDAIRQYQNQSLQDYKKHVQYNLFKLLIAQLFIIILVFLVGWLRLFYSFVDQIAKTKNIFKVFHINVLYENDYIQSYFRQMQIKSKN